MFKFEEKINYQLNKFPIIKKVVKRIYQLSMYAISSKIKSEGNIVRISPNDDKEYFFGYYDKSPWDNTGRYMLCLRVKETRKDVAPQELAEIILIDTKKLNSYKILASTHTWNVQQGCMLQWLGPNNSDEIIYNDFRNNTYCSVILNINTKKEKIIKMPIYSVSQDGSFALTLDFSRLHRLRKGYGYSNLIDMTENDKCPDEPCIWHINFKNGETKPLLKYTDFVKFESKSSMTNAEHKVNHIMINPAGKRFMVLHRWYKGTRKYTRLITINCDGTNFYNLSDDDMTSHCCWKNDFEILAFARKKNSGNGYYLMCDQTQKFKKLWPQLDSDGHPSYSPDKNLLITDTYPDRTRMASILLINGTNIKKIVKVFAPFAYDNDTRCDLHPRWNRTGDIVCFDAIFEGKRRLYITNL